MDWIWSGFLQVITLEGWVEIMYYVMDAHSFYNFIYFIFLIIVSLVFTDLKTECNSYSFFSLSLSLQTIKPMNFKAF